MAVADGRGSFEIVILEGRHAIAIKRSTEYYDIGAKWCRDVLERGEDAVAKVA